MTNILLLLLACAPVKTTPSESLADTDVDTAADTAVDTAVDSGADTGMDTVDSGADTGPTPTTVVIDPDCPDGQFEEEIPDTAEDLADLVATYDSYTPADFITAALALRYPLGNWIVDGGSDTLGQDCGAYIVDHYLDASFTSSAPSLFLSATVVVHECGHLFDAMAGSGDASGYRLNETTTLLASGAEAPDAPAMSRIIADTWSEARPPCPDAGPSGCDEYAEVYLSGDPDDDVFDTGDQALNILIEELVQYNHSLAVGIAFADQITPSTERDGVLTMLWYVERYLAYWRVADPDAYRASLEDGGMAEAILTIWGQSWDLLAASDGVAVLGIDDARIDALVEEPELLGEVDALRGMVGCR